jgi:hypothetical protein
LARVQLAINVADIGESIRFYSRLFATEPAKVRPGYANFAVADPPLKLVLVEDKTKEPGSLNHLGVEVDSASDVAAAKLRLAHAGLATTTEEEVTCCYALQDKVWAVSPAGEPWEFYTVLAGTEMGAEVPGDANQAGPIRCAERPDLGGPVTGPTG